MIEKIIQAPQVWYIKTSRHYVYMSVHVYMYMYICTCICVCVYMYLHILFFRFSNRLSRVPCATHQILVGYLFYIQQCIHDNTNLLLNPSSNKKSQIFKCSFYFNKILAQILDHFLLWLPAPHPPRPPITLIPLSQSYPPVPQALSSLHAAASQNFTLTPRVASTTCAASVTPASVWAPLKSSPSSQLMSGSGPHYLLHLL